MDRSLADKIWALLEPMVVKQGYEIVELEAHAAKNGIVRVYLDSKDGVSLDKCAEFSRAFSELLDAEDPIKSNYTLEVSSPGLNRPLRKAAHFKKAIGEEVQLKVARPGGKLQKLRGKLVAADEASIQIKNQVGSMHAVALTDVRAANVIYDVAAALKAHSGS
jgi:ribosome maturation factor RimP